MGAISLHWVPGHVGVAGNERADQAAKAACSLPDITFVLRDGPGKIIKPAERAIWQWARDDHQLHVAEASRSATWYARATRYEPLQLPPHIPNYIVVRLRRLRLGYLTYKQITNSRPDPCEHCNEIDESPLLHYILRCPITHPIRECLGRGFQWSQSDDVDAPAVIANTSQSTLLNILTKYNPPK